MYGDRWMDIHIYRQTDIQTYMAHAYIQTDGHNIYRQMDGWMNRQAVLYFPICNSTWPFPP